MGEQYFKGVLAGYLGANFMYGPITEWQILETLWEQATKVERISSKKTFRIIAKRQLTIPSSHIKRKKTKSAK